MDQHTISMKDATDFFRRRWPMTGAVALVVFLGAVVTAFTIENVYRSVGEVSVTEPAYPVGPGGKPTQPLDQRIHDLTREVLIRANLLEAVETKFHNRGLGRAWALMTNDNLRAAGLYLSRGYRLIRVHVDAVDKVREHKPELPDRGYEGIAIRDLWEFEKLGPLVGVPVP